MVEKGSCSTGVRGRIVKEEGRNQVWPVSQKERREFQEGLICHSADHSESALIIGVDRFSRAEETGISPSFFFKPKLLPVFKNFQIKIQFNPG